MNRQMAERVRITDVSPRDGLQNEPGIIPTEQKVELVRLLCETGVDEVEVTSFVSPKWVPQLGDAAEVLESLTLREGSGSPSQREGAGGRVEDGTAHQSSKGVGGRQDGSLIPAKSAITQERARQLRKSATGPEQELWKRLQCKQLGGFEFRRQHPFGPFILDFYCVSEMLAVELDGATHRLPEARTYDTDRTKYLEQHDLRVLRFSDDDVVMHADAVARVILETLQGRGAVARLEPSPQLPLSGRGSRTPQFSVLVPNERGVQGVLDVNARAKRPLVAKVAVFTAASEAFSKRNTNATIGESIERFKPVMFAAKGNALVIRGYISCIIACPFEGPITPQAVVDVAIQLRDIGVDEIDLGDTIGAATPETLHRLLDAVGRIFMISESEKFTLHLHDTFGRAAECVKVALDMGVRSFDGSVAGLGGCPYASTPGKRAPGNISTQTLVQTIHDAGYSTGVDPESLDVAGRFASRIVTESRLRAAETKP